MPGEPAKIAKVFRPKRQWKPKRKDRNIGRRRKRKKWWRRNKNRLKMQRRRTYKMLKHNSLFKQWRKKRQKEKHRRRMRFGSEDRMHLPEVWFVFRDDVEEDAPIELGLGFIEDYDPDTEELLIYDIKDDSQKVIGLDDFLTHSQFLEEADLDNFDLLLDQFYGGPEDDLEIIDDDDEAPRMEFEVDFEEFTKKVAQAWLFRPSRRRRLS